MHPVGFGRERKVFSMNEMHLESAFPCDYITSRNGYCKRVMTSKAESKRVLKITNCTKYVDLHGMRCPFSAWTSEQAWQTCCSNSSEETAEHTFCYCERFRPFWEHVGEWTASIEPKQLVLLDAGYFVDNVLPSFQEAFGVARTVIWTTRKKGLYDDANLSHRHRILFFRHQLRVRSDAIENAWIA